MLHYNFSQFSTQISWSKLIIFHTNKYIDKKLMDIVGKSHFPSYMYTMLIYANKDLTTTYHFLIKDNDKKYVNP